MKAFNWVEGFACNLKEVKAPAIAQSSLEYLRTALTGARPEHEMPRRRLTGRLAYFWGSADESQAQVRQ
jgi:hypothetical protein